MRLLVSDLSLPVTQMGADFLLVHQPVNHPPARASLVLRVDERERCWNVHLPHGITASSNRVAIERSV